MVCSLHLCQFYFSDKTIYMNETATLDRNINDIYEIKLQCNDGTDTTESILTLELTKEIDDAEGPPGTTCISLGAVVIIW